MTLTHDFNERLAFSHAQSDAPWWAEVYRKAFPDFKTMTDLREDGDHQRMGRDRAITLFGGTTIYVDEKARDKDWGDMFVEVWSIYPQRSGPPYPPVRRAVPGWACKPLDCDYLAYAVVPARTCHLFPFQGIRAAWERFGTEWVAWANKGSRGHNNVAWAPPVPNDGYDTIGLTMSLPRWRAAINEALTIRWAD